MYVYIYIYICMYVMYVCMYVCIHIYQLCEGPPRHEHNSDTKRGVASAMKPPDKTNPILYVLQATQASNFWGTPAHTRNK